MRTALRSGWVGLVAAVMLVGCPGPARPIVNGDTGTHDGGGTTDSGPLADTGPTPDTGIRVDSGGMAGACSYGGGCDLLSATSCPDVDGTRQACYPGETMSQCAPAGSVGDGGACTNLNDCDTGLVCLSTGTCASACCGNADCELGETCRPLSGAGGTVGVCIRPTSCTPLPNSCPDGQQCQLTGSDGSTDCGGTGPNTEGMPCGDSGGCVEGLGCYGPAGGAAMCIRFCRLGMDADCTGGGTCNASGLGSDMFGLCQGG
jgi:hypothetical protein